MNAMAKEEDDDNLPDKDAAKEFYARYEPKEIIGRWENNCGAHKYLAILIICVGANF